MKILIADYHALLRDGLGMLVKELASDVDVLHSDSYARVLETVPQGGIDLALVDSALPGFESVRSTRDLVAACPGVPIVIMAASERWSDACTVIECGARGYIPKSASSAIMLAALRLILSGGIYLPPLMAQSSAPAGPRGAPPGPRDTADRGGDGPRLTPRQLEVLRCLAQGQSNKEIAYQLGLSQGTVKIHIAAIFRAFKVRNRTQAVIAAGLRS